MLKSEKVEKRHTSALPRVCRKVKKWKRGIQEGQQEYVEKRKSGKEVYKRASKSMSKSEKVEKGIRFKN